MTSAVESSGNKSRLLENILSSSPPVFALIYRPESSGNDLVDILTGKIKHLDELADISRCYPETPTSGVHEILTLIPHRQITERGFECVDDKEPLIALCIDTATSLAKCEMLKLLPDSNITLSGMHYDMDDAVYAETASRIIKDEIGGGAGSNFVLKRSFIASVDNFSHHKALTLFRRLLEQEVGAYWVFIIYTGNRFFVGATPERHISLEQTIVTMNPISGTYKYPENGPDMQGLLGFLANRKEAEELNMVVDEELKMMGDICERGGTIKGPYLKPMQRLAHTEYLIKGRSRLQPWEILRKTMFAPAVIGSPLENACRVIKMYEPEGRAYYGGVVALLGRDTGGQHRIDSSILIRTADINKYGTIKISTGATLVQHSIPTSEAVETLTKASGLLKALGVSSAAAQEFDTPITEKSCTVIFNDPEVKTALKDRNKYLSIFWQISTKERAFQQKRFEGRKVLVLNAEDAFTSMICHQLNALGLAVTVINMQESINYELYDLYVLGPGPGDPSDISNPRVKNLHSTVMTLLKLRRHFLAICLSHQVLCYQFGLDVVRKSTPNQGAQKEIDLFGRLEKVGFYNTFSVLVDGSSLKHNRRGSIEFSHDDCNSEIHALRGPHFASFQFHPESVLTQHGVAILESAIDFLLESRACTVTS